MISPGRFNIACFETKQISFNITVEMVHICISNTRTHEHTNTLI